MTVARPTWPGSLARSCRLCRVRAARQSIRSLVVNDFAITDSLDDSRAPDRLQRKSQRRHSHFMLESDLMLESES
jgi:hypothetical protein